jgi:hypothetical protein
MLYFYKPDCRKGVDCVPGIMEVLSNAMFVYPWSVTIVLLVIGYFASGRFRNRVVFSVFLIVGVAYFLVAEFSPHLIEGIRF